MYKVNTARRTAPSYRLAQRDSEGRLFILTQLGEFASGLAARDAWRAQPRVGVAYIQECRDLIKNGVCYGLKTEIIATV